MTGRDKQSDPVQRSILWLVEQQPSTKLKPATAKQRTTPKTPTQTKNIPQATPIAVEF